MELIVEGVSVNVTGLLFTIPVVAVMVVLPVTRPVAIPLLLTVAAAGLLTIHVKVAPRTGFPFASFAVAANC